MHLWIVQMSLSHQAMHLVLMAKVLYVLHLFKIKVVLQEVVENIKNSGIFSIEKIEELVKN